MDSRMISEIHKRSIKVIKNTEAKVAWNNNLLALLLDKEIRVFEIGNNLESFDRGLDLTSSTITCPTTSVATKLFEGYKSHMKPLAEVIESNLDPVMWPHNPELLKDIVIFISFEWSSIPLHNNRHLISTLTNTGHIELYGYEGIEWISVLNISLELYEMLNIKYTPKDFSKNKEAAQELFTTAMCWEKSKKQAKHHLHIVCAQQNGDILFLRLESESKLQIKLKKKYESRASISALQWIEITENDFILLYATVSGELFALNCCFKKNELTIEGQACLWHYKDKMPVQHLKYTYVENQLILLFAKHRHFIALTYNKVNPEQSNHTFINVDDERITSLSEYEKKIIITTEYFKIHAIELNMKDSALSLTSSLVQMKDTYKNQYLYHLSISRNGTIWVLCTLEFNSIYKSGSQLINIVFCEIDHSLEKHFLDPNARVPQIWDCIELTRYKATTAKSWPESLLSLDMEKFYATANNNLPKLRVFLELLRIINRLKLLKSNSYGPTLPEVTENEVKEQIYFKHAQNLLNTLVTCYKKNKKLTDFQMDSFVFVKDYLEYYSKKYKCSKGVTGNVFKMVQLKTDYECQCCDEPYNGKWYGSSHMNMMCSVSFSQINSDEYLHCPRCKVIARIELQQQNAICTLCETTLIKV